MNYFQGCFDEKQIKSRYRELCKVHHPDLGGSEETMKQVNLAYEERLRMEFRKDYSNEEAENFVNLERELATKIAEIIGLKGVIVELVGRWIWVTGDTFPVRQLLKAASFCFASKKRAWFFHLPEDTCPSRAKKTMSEIRTKYGSRVYTASTRFCLT